MMETVKHYLLYPVAGIPAWFWVLAFVIAPLINEWVARTKSIKAQSIFQAIGNVLSTPRLARLPWVIQVVTIFPFLARGAGRVLKTPNTVVLPPTDAAPIILPPPGPPSGGAA